MSRPIPEGVTITSLEDAIGKIVRCTDGDVRRLTKIEPHLGHYEVPVSDTQWIDLGGTKAYQCRELFIGGKVMPCYPEPKEEEDPRDRAISVLTPQEELIRGLVNVIHEWKTDPFKILGNGQAPVSRTKEERLGRIETRKVIARFIAELESCYPPEGGCSENSSS